MKPQVCENYAGMQEPAEQFLDSDRLQELLPHRYPFAMLDHVSLLPAECRARGVKYVGMNEPFFQGHFPGAPVMPGVLILETMIQTAAVITRRLLDPGEEPFLLTVRRTKFRRPVMPGDVLIADVRMVGAKRQMIRFQATAESGGNKVCQTEFILGRRSHFRMRSARPAAGDPGPAKLGVALAGAGDIQRVLEVIPHRYPFLMLDGVLEISDRYITAVKNISRNEPYLNGHFPDYPIVPGTLLIETIAQAGAYFILSRPANEGKLGFFMAIESARFRLAVRPGRRLIIYTELLADRARVGRARGRIMIGNQTVAEAGLSFAIVDRGAYLAESGGAEERRKQAKP